VQTKDLILERLQRLLCLGLDGQPAAELIPGTARIWTEHLANVSADRLQTAFDAVEQSCKRWPTVAHIRECLPFYAVASLVEPEKRIEPEVSNESRARVAALIRETARMFRA